MHREQPGARGVWSEEDGFTLLELMMVVLIIAILIAVLIPVFLGATTRAKDRAVQSNLSTALDAAKSAFTSQNADYSTVTPALLSNEAGALTWVASNSTPTSPSTVSVLQAPAGNTQQLILAAQSKSGSCFYVLDDESNGARFAKLPGAGGCAANGAPIPTDPSWKATW